MTAVKTITVVIGEGIYSKTFLQFCVCFSNFFTAKRGANFAHSYTSLAAIVGSFPLKVTFTRGLGGRGEEGGEL